MQNRKKRGKCFYAYIFASILWLGLWTEYLKIMLKTPSQEMKMYVCLKMLINIITSVAVTKLLGYKTSRLTMRSTNLN